MMQVGNMGTQKSVGLANLLPFLFGPLGTFYGLVVGGAVILVSTVLIGWLIIPLPFICIGCIVPAVAGASQHNGEVQAGSPWARTSEEDRIIELEVLSIEPAPDTLLGRRLVGELSQAQRPSP